MNHAGTRIRGSRMVMVCLMLVTPLAGPGSLTLVCAAVSSITAYEGLHRDTIYGIVAILFGIELMYGLDVGVLSLSYVAAVLVLSLVRRVVAIAPWTSASGWRGADALRTLIVACGLFAVITACTVIIGHFLYGYADVLVRLQSMFLPYRMAWTPIIIAVMLVILRRIDEPFRRRITFGI